mmetsp:Transcript_13967/g.21126  ORF Transcript_13967/g.21126 Transcript_13967/m.21126 type:complete len:99 (+) Transcript_13967:118-414(+)
MHLGCNRSSLALNIALLVESINKFSFSIVNGTRNENTFSKSLPKVSYDQYNQYKKYSSDAYCYNCRAKKHAKAAIMFDLNEFEDYIAWQDKAKRHKCI